MKTLKTAGLIVSFFLVSVFSFDRGWKACDRCGGTEGIIESRTDARMLELAPGFMRVEDRRRLWNEVRQEEAISLSREGYFSSK